MKKIFTTNDPKDNSVISKTFPELVNQRWPKVNPEDPEARAAWNKANDLRIEQIIKSSKGETK
jgi:hypothetical protein